MFDPNKTYDENYLNGPLKEWLASGDVWPVLRYLDDPRYQFLDLPLHLPFGIPAGPLLHAGFMNRALDAGFCMPTYKTVRSHAFAGHPLPNILEITEYISAEIPRTAMARALTKDVTQTLPPSGAGFSITNSFGVPSQSSPVWQQDFNSLLLRPGYVNVLSFQPTAQGCFEDLLQDAKRTANAAQKTNAAMFEVNLSCPNEEGMPLYSDFKKAGAVLKTIREQLPQARLVAKIGMLSEDETLEFVRQTCETLDGVSAINTLRCRILDAKQQPALGPSREFGGVCGQLIFDCGVFMIKSLAGARKRLGLSPRRFGLIGVGGVFSPSHVDTYLEAGADVVQAATGAMWNLELAAHVAAHLRVRTRRKRDVRNVHDQTRSD